MRQIMKGNSALRTRRSSGFTLVELMVVLVIASIVSGLTLSGFKSLTRSNNRTSCQVNMTQIYQAIRLYAADENGGFPLYDAATPGSGIGLWALYTYPNPNNPNSLARPDDGAPIERYLRHSKSLHCPADDGDADETLLVADPGDSTKQIYNPNYLSYQTNDTFLNTAVPGQTTQDEATYQPSRTSAGKSACAGALTVCDWKRQLLHNNAGALEARPPTDDTVVTWCKWHRPPTDTPDLTQPYDNVLFYDGTVRYLSITQAPNSVAITGWRREPTAP